MPTRSAANATAKTGAKTPQSGSQSAKTQSADPIASLIVDHHKVKALFEEFASLKAEDGRARGKRVVERICLELKIHTAVEEEIFTPPCKEIDDENLMDEALVEHAGAKDLIAQLEVMDTEDDLYNATVTVLGEQIDHHVEEEEDEMFPKAKKAKVNTEQLASKMDTRRELMAEFGAPVEQEAA